MKGKLFSTILATMLVLMFGVAQANPYISLAYVDTDFNIDEPFNQLLTDNSNNGVSVALGWQTAYQPLSFEVEYTDFGDVASERTTQGKYYTFVEKANYDMEALSFWAIGRYKVFEVFDRPVKVVPRLGVSAINSTGTYQQQIVYDEATYVGEVKDDASGIGLAWGLGVEANVYKNLDAFVDYRKRSANGLIFGEGVKLDPGTWQAGLTYRF